MVNEQGQDISAVKDQLVRLLHEHVAVELELLRDDVSLFDLGLDSASMLSLTELLRRSFGVSLALSEIMSEHGTIGDLAHTIADRRRSIVGAPPTTNGTHSPARPGVALGSAGAHAASLAPTSSMQASLIDVLQQQRATMERVFAQQLELLSGLTGRAKEPAAPPNGAHEAAVPPPASAPRPHASAAISGERERALSDFVQDLPVAAPESKRLAQQYRSVWADIDESAGFSIPTKEAQYLISIERGDGARFTDVDGNEYVDIAMGYGSLLFGHSPGFLVEALRAELDRGLQLGPRHRLCGDVAERLARLTGFDRVTLTATGTEAVMAAMKIARAATGKPKIAIFTGGYHGHADATLVTKFRADGPTLPIAPGVSSAASADMLVLDYDDDSAIEAVKAHAHELAAVLVEPVQSRRPELQPRAFLARLRAATAEHGVLLAFDEVITGFRCHLGGAAALFGIRPDLAVYGKAVCNGVPVGVVAGRRELMDTCDGGDWRFGDRSYPGATQTYFAGTFFKHPLTLAACDATLKHFEAEGNALQERLTSKTAKLVDRLNADFEAYSVPIHVVRFASLFLFKPTEDLDRRVMDVFFHVLRQKGVFTWPGRTCFLSTEHGDGELDQIVTAVSATVKALLDANVLRGRMPRNDARSRGFQPGIPDKIFYE